jgi:hypothetical protein
MRAEQVSAAVDRLIQNPDAQIRQFEADDAGMLATAHRLARLPALMEPLDPALERQILRRVRTGAGQRRMPRLRLGWAIAGLATILLVVLFTPMGQTAVASFMAVFNLGRTEVCITPVDTPTEPLATVAAQGPVVRQSLTLEETQAQVSFTILQPTFLPPGYRLHEVRSYVYPDMSPWVPQPLFVELVYGDKLEGEFSLRLYPIMLGDKASIAGLNLQATPIRNVQDVDVNGQPGVLLQLGSDKSKSFLQEIVWEQGDLILALSTSYLSQVDLLRIARSLGEP